MYFVHCPLCGVEVEVPANAVGPDRTDPWNVIGCDECDCTFSYDDEEVQVGTKTAEDATSDQTGKEVKEVDPTQCYLEMFEAMNQGDLEAGRERALALEAWLENGGFYPPNYTKVEVDAYLANVLRRTAHI